MPPIGSLFQRDLFPFEGDGLVNLKVLQRTPLEGLVDFVHVVVGAVDAQEVVHVDDYDGYWFPQAAALHEDHLVEGVLLAVEVGQALDHGE